MVIVKEHDFPRLESLACHDEAFVSASVCSLRGLFACVLSWVEILKLTYVVYDPSHGNTKVLTVVLKIGY